MSRRPRVTDATDYFGEFLEERPGLWPERDDKRDAVDPFSEFGTEIEPGADRWLHAAHGGELRPPNVHDYRHMLAVASVVLSLFTPAGVISTAIVARELTVSPRDVGNALPPLPARQLAAPVDQLIGLPAIGDLPTPPRRPAESDANGESSPASRNRPQSSPAWPGASSAAPTGPLPLTTALLLASTGPEAGLEISPTPARSTPPPAIATAPVAPPAAPVSPPAASTPAAPSPAPAESVAVRAALNRYREAFSNLDAGSAKSVWPAVDEKTLVRAFSQMSSQEFVFDACRVDVTGPRATASCQGRAQYVPKVGSRSARSEPRSWTFTLRRAETHWTIESVDSR